MKNESELVALFKVPKYQSFCTNIRGLLNNCMRDDYYNAHVMIKYKVVENYFNGDSREWWNIYNDMQYKRVSPKTNH